MHINIYIFLITYMVEFSHGFVFYCLIYFQLLLLGYHLEISKNIYSFFINLLIHFLVCLLNFGKRVMVLSTYSWLCTRGLLPVVLRQQGSKQGHLHVSNCLKPRIIYLLLAMIMFIVYFSRSIELYNLYLAELFCNCRTHLIFM